MDAPEPEVPETPHPCAALLAEVKRDCGALRAARRRRLAVFVALAVCTVGLLIVMMPARSPGAGTVGHGALVGGYALLGLALCALAFGATLPAGRQLRPVAVLGAAAALGLLLVTALSFSGETMPFGAGAKCLAVGLVTALAIAGAGLGVGRGVLRRHAPTGLLLGVGAGLLALLPLHFACPDCTAAHLLSWHGLVPPLSGVIAGLAWGWLRAP